MTSVDLTRFVDQRYFYLPKKVLPVFHAEQEVVIATIDPLQVF